MKCPYCNKFKGNNKVRGYPVSEQLKQHISVDHDDIKASWHGAPKSLKLTTYIMKNGNLILVGSK